MNWTFVLVQKKMSQSQSGPLVVNVEIIKKTDPWRVGLFSKMSLPKTSPYGSGVMVTANTSRYLPSESHRSTSKSSKNTTLVSS